MYKEETIDELLNDYQNLMYQNSQKTKNSSNNSDECFPS